MRPFSRTQKMVTVSNHTRRLPTPRTERRTQNDNADEIIIILPELLFCVCRDGGQNGGIIIMYQFYASKQFADETKKMFPEIFADTPEDEVLPTYLCVALHCAKSRNADGCENCPDCCGCEIFARSIDDQRV